jgi:hypothetical protein
MTVTNISLMMKVVSIQFLVNNNTKPLHRITVNNHLAGRKIGLPQSFGRVAVFIKELVSL